MTETQQDMPQQRLMHFPITFFAIVMGLSGLTLAFHAAASLFPAFEQITVLTLWFTTLVFAAISLLYLAKLVKHKDQVKGEWNHPVRLAFFPAISISILLLALAWFHQIGDVVRPVFMLGVIAQAVLTLSVISGWVGNRSFQHGHLSPAWFIPAVGNVLVPLIGVPLGYTDLSWFFFSFGIVFWIVLLTLVVNRLIFHDPLPGKLQPTLVILIAPPAIGFVAWVLLVGGLDPFGRILVNSAYVFAAIVIVQLPRLFTLPFAMSFWALSFPVAALTVASFRYGELGGNAFFTQLGTGLLVVLTILIAGLLLRTVKAAMAGQVCVPE